MSHALFFGAWIWLRLLQADRCIKLGHGLGKSPPKPRMLKPLRYAVGFDAGETAKSVRRSSLHEAHGSGRKKLKPKQFLVGCPACKTRIALASLGFDMLT
jgi:hypothetical protein